MVPSVIYDWETLQITAVNKLNVLVTYGYNRCTKHTVHQLAWENEVQRKKKPTFLMSPDIPHGLLSICHSGKHGEVALPKPMKCCIGSEGNCFFDAKH